MSDDRKIITRSCWPPIPWRHFDWCAWRDGDEGDNTTRRGWGTSEQEAIDDLLRLEDDDKEDDQ